MTILVDMDDTIEQLLRAWIHAVNKTYGTDVRHEDIRSWNFTDAFPSLTEEQIYDVVLNDDFWKTVEPIPDADRVLQQWIDAGHEVYIVTATPLQGLVGKMEHCLFRYFPFIDWNHVIITARKQLLKADVLIDDGVHNHEGGDYKKVLVTAGHNRAYDAEANGMIRADNWQEIERIVAELEKECS